VSERRRSVAVVGSSWGGMYALARLLGQLDAGCGMSIAVAQHRAPDRTGTVLVDYLQKASALHVSEAGDKLAIEPANVYVAPADYHLFVEPGHFALSIDAPVQQSRPSIDVLFDSAADAYGDEVVAVILTGANDDGAHGIGQVKQRGGLTLAQDPETAERREMPEAAIATGAVDRVLSVEEIGDLLNHLCRT
jgi:two-component system chemotaxis response regulator CheB